MPRERTGHSKHPLPTTQGRLYTWTSPDGQHRNQIDYILCTQRWRKSIQSAKTKLGADCGSDHELLIPKFRLKLKKVWKTTRPYRYDLNQIPYDHSVEVRNRFKGSDLIECLMNYGLKFVTLYGDRDQDHPHGKELQKSKMAVEEALQIAMKRREVKSKGEMEIDKHLNAEFQRLAGRDKKAFPGNQCTEIEENNRMGKPRDLFKKIRERKITRKSLRR